MSLSDESRREFLVSVAGARLAAPSARRPNVLVFMTDQESAMLPGPVNRPAYDSLRSRGVTFRHAFCNTPQCSPARSSLLTGLAPHRSGVLTNVDASSLGRALSPKIPTVGTVFRDGGYRTGYFGKWHLGDEPIGFAEYHAGGDNAATDAAAQWIKTQSDPWLAWVSILNPHNIYQIVERAGSVPSRRGVRAPSTTKADLAAKPSPQLRYLNEDQGRPTRSYTAEDWIRYRSLYCELVEKADRCFHSALSAVKDRDNTIVVYTSDHGDALGEHGLPFKGPFMYEPLIRVPLVMAGPGLTKKTTRDDFVVSADLAPTLAGLAGLQWPAPIDGKDLSRKASGRDAVFLEYYAKQHWVEPIRTIRTAKWKLSCYENGGGELYDLEKDAAEATNLYNEPKWVGIRKRLAERLEHWWPGMRAK